MAEQRHGQRFRRVEAAVGFEFFGHGAQDGRGDVQGDGREMRVGAGAQVVEQVGAE